jgi:hypothetical protein
MIRSAPAVLAPSDEVFQSIPLDESDDFFPSQPQVAPAASHAQMRAAPVLRPAGGFFGGVSGFGAAAGGDEAAMQPPLPIWVWGFGGRCFVMHPRARRSPSAFATAQVEDGPLVPGVFMRTSFSQWGASDPELSLLTSFPGNCFFDKKKGIQSQSTP